ncbi:MAG: ATP-binding protein, partial [Acidimicrobiales bacterium]
MSSQTATILVTDLVGSTELRVALGEERAEALRRVHDRLLTDAVTGNGGEVVKGLGDGVLALFSGAAEAVGAAVAIQQAVAAHVQRRPDDRLSVRVGISAGDVTLEDDDCFGTPVVEASRLCAEAAGEEILVADLVRLLARGRGDHEFTPAGERTLKGLPDPVPVATVGWSRAAPDGAPMPSALRVAQWYDFAGREAERATLLDRWKAAVDAGEPGLVVVSGEPGIGKTRLVAELASTAHDGGATVLYGRSEEELDVPFRPWVEALEHLVGHVPGEVLAVHLDEWGSDLVRLVPGLDVPEPPRTDPDSERLRLFGAVTDLLTRAGEESPVLVVLDDLHWADDSSLLLLRHLVRNMDEARVLVVGTYRDTDLTRTHPLAAALADLRREAGVERVDLTGLDQDEVTLFLTQAGGNEVDPEQVTVLAEMVWTETEGNPFFIGEVLVHLVESGALVQREGRWEGDRGLIEQIGLPEGIREVIGRRLAGLDEATNELLRAAAVIGPAFDAAVLAEAVDREVDDVVRVLDDAGSRRLVIEDDDVLDRFRFAHALIRQTLLEELRTGRRVRLHHRVALALEARGAPAADLSHHFSEAAALVDAEKAIAYAGLAAEEAAGRLAFEQVVSFRRLAVETEELLDPPDASRRAELRIALGEARNTASDPSAARADFVAAAEDARRAERPDLLARAAYGYGGESGVWLDFSDAVGPALLHEALTVLPDDRVRERALCLTQSSGWHVLDADPTTHLAEAKEGLRLAEQSGDVRARSRALDIARQAFGNVGDLDGVLEISGKMRALGEEFDDVRSLSMALSGEMTARFVGNDLDGARALLVDLLAMDRRQLPLAHWWSRVSTAANLAILDGRWDEIISPTAEETAAIGVTGATLDRNHQMRVLFDQGDNLAAAEVARANAVEHGDQLIAWPVQALADWMEGGSTSADLLESWHREVFEHVPSAFRVHAIAMAAPIAVDHRLTDIAIDLVTELRPRRGQWASWSTEIADRLVDHA